MASPSESNFLELRVGVFVLIGLAVIGSMVVIFGRIGTGIAARRTRSRSNSPMPVASWSIPKFFSPVPPSAW